MAQAQATSQVFLNQVAPCEGRSPLYAELLRRYADDPVAAEIVGPEPEWDAPLRLLGGLHYLVLGGRADWDDPLEQHRGFLSDFVATQGVQTNEVQRSWVLVPLLLRVAQRTGAETFDLVELGPSAGLNLVWDRYGYRYEAGEWGPEDAQSSVRGGGAKADSGRPSGAPADGSRASGDRPGADRRHDRARARVCCAPSSGPAWTSACAGSTRRSRRCGPTRRSSSAATTSRSFRRCSPALPRDGLTVVFQTASFGYIGDEGRARVRSVLEEAGEARRLAFISTGKPRAPEEHCWGLRLVYWPGGEREFAGHADFHGSWLQWELA